MWAGARTQAEAQRATRAHTQAKTRTQTAARGRAEAEARTGARAEAGGEAVGDADGASADTDGQRASGETDVSADTPADDNQRADGNMASGSIAADTRTEAAFTNTKQAGALTLSKQVAGNGAEPARTFAFAVRLTDTDGAPLSGDFSTRWRQAVTRAARAPSALPRPTRTASLPWRAARPSRWRRVSPSP